MILPYARNVELGLWSATAGMEDLLAAAVIRGANTPGQFDEVKDKQVQSKALYFIK